MPGTPTHFGPHSPALTPKSESRPGPCEAVKLAELRWALLSPGRMLLPNSKGPVLEWVPGATLLQVRGFLWVLVWQLEKTLSRTPYGERRELPEFPLSPGPLRSPPFGQEQVDQRASWENLTNSPHPVKEAEVELPLGVAQCFQLD